MNNPIIIAESDYPGEVRNTPPAGKKVMVNVSKEKNRGVTILEILIALAILGILAAMALPSMMDTISRMSVNSAARSISASLSLARSEAVKRGHDVSICATSDGADCDAGNWVSGWIVFVDENNDADGDVGSIDEADGDTVIRVFEPLANMVLTVAPATNLIVYDNKGYGKNSSILTFTICPVDGKDENAKEVEVSLSGRARIEGEGVSCS